MPIGCKNKSLARWVCAQRINYNAKKLAQEKIELIASLGFDWFPYDTQWNSNFKKLQLFKEQQGHCSVPQGSQNKLLALWGSKQRQNYKKGKLEQEKIDLLTSLGFDWFPLDTQWDENFKQLNLFKEQHGHCNVPQKYENKSLATWVGTQRKNYKKNLMNEERIHLLNSLGFIWRLR